MEKYDLIVIGAGPGGYVAAQRAGQLGKRVLLIEKEHLGGVCTNKGCIPTKSLLHSAKLYHEATQSKQFGVSVAEAVFDWQAALAWKDDTVQTLRSSIQFLMKQSKVETISGEAQLLDENHVQVGSERYFAEHIIIANGSKPALPPIEGIGGSNVVTSDQILELTELPKSLAVVGGGVIGIEFASLFSSLGTKVTVIEMLDEVVPMMDHQLAKLLRREMRDVTFHLSSKVNKIVPDGLIFTNAKDAEVNIESELVLISVGRSANLSGLGALSFIYEKGFLAVDDQLRTNYPNIYAIGDVNGKSLLAHSASRMAEVVIANLYEGKEEVVRYNAIPWALYSQPEAAGCGLTEEEARHSGREVKVATIQLRSNGRFLAEHGKRASGVCKVVVDAHSEQVLGFHLLGPYSSEIVGAGATIIAQGLRVEEVKNLVFPHPSLSEAIKDAVFAL